MKIVVIDDYQNVFRTVPAFDLLREHDVVVYRDTEKDVPALATRLRDAEVVVLTQQRSAFPSELIRRLPRLRLVAQTGTHRDHIDLAACTVQGIAVAGGGGARLNATAELTWGLIIAGIRRIPEEAAELKRGLWQTTIGSMLYGKTLGVYALGRIGSLVAQVGAAFGMRICCWGRESSLARAQASGYEIPASREAFFSTADVLSLHLPLNEETRGIITGADLGRMKSTALLVNTSRAGLIAEGAVVVGLGQGRPGRAAVDVYEQEPVTGGRHPLLAMPNALCTPHLGYNVRELYETLYARAIENIVAFAAGTPVNLLNPEVLSRPQSKAEEST